mmetsp:Transcript_20852/g.28107  ORF Transcript_20852/g.28107 Transcript_20852/m.28107 type:complete len:85 (+) Transcript_20852:1838-2092(+)
MVEHVDDCFGGVLDEPLKVTLHFTDTLQASLVALGGDLEQGVAATHVANVGDQFENGEHARHHLELLVLVQTVDIVVCLLFLGS